MVSPFHKAPTVQPRPSPTSSAHKRSVFQNSNKDRKKRESATLQEMKDVTLKYLERMEENSHFFKSSSVGIVVPRFEPYEIELETTIGMGEFGVVLEVGTISLNPRSDQQKTFAGDSNNERIGPIEHHNESPALWLSLQEQPIPIDDLKTNRILRQDLAEICRQSSSSTSSSDDRYDDSSIELAPPVSSCIAMLPTNSLLSVKQIRKDLYPKKRIEAAKDLAREAKLLARLQQLYFCDSQKNSQDTHPYHHHSHKSRRNNHPNLITLRGIVSAPGSPHFGILLDRLNLTLAELATSWRKRQEVILEQLANSHSRRQRLFSMGPPQWLVPPDRFVENLAHKVGVFFHQSGEDPNDSGELEEDLLNTTRTIKASPRALLLLGERILALYDVSEGMSHLHRHKILYRDLKTENVGRTSCFKQGTRVNQSQLLQHECHHQDHYRMQLFDFGLAKECKSFDRVSESPKSSTAVLEEDILNETRCPEDAGNFYDSYKMTGMTGTMRIMAPEVIRCLPYGLPADVYSFGICMWEVFTGTKCNFLSAAEICDRKKIVRPKLPRVFGTEEGSVGMPKELQVLMQQCWNEDPNQRPNFGEICSMLRSILGDLHRQSHSQRLQMQHQPYHRYQSQDNFFSSSFLSKRIDGRRFMASPWRSCVTGTNKTGSIWNTMQNASEPRKQNPNMSSSSLSDATDSTATALSSDQSGFWSRLETIRTSGLLNDQNDSPPFLL